MSQMVRMSQLVQMIQMAHKDDGEETTAKKNTLTFTFRYQFVFWLFTRCFYIMQGKTSCKQPENKVITEHKSKRVLHCSCFFSIIFIDPFDPSGHLSIMNPSNLIKIINLWNHQNFWNLKHLEPLETSEPLDST